MYMYAYDNQLFTATGGIIVAVILVAVAVTILCTHLKRKHKTTTLPV